MWAEKQMAGGSRGTPRLEAIREKEVHTKSYISMGRNKREMDSALAQITFQSTYSLVVAERISVSVKLIIT